MMRIFILAAALALGAVVARADDLPQLPYQVGPLAAPIADQATLKLPERYAFFARDDAKELLKRMGNFPDDSVQGLVTAPGADWFIVLTYVGVGYIPDDDAKDWKADDLLASIKEGTANDNERRKEAGQPPLEIEGWAEPPHYDAATHKLSWALVSLEDGKRGVNYKTMGLGRYGYVGMNLVTSLDRLPKNRGEAELLLANLDFVDSKRYADFSSTTDKVAAFGLAALVAGVAAKTGLLAKLLAFALPILLVVKKFVVYIVVVAGATIWRLFKRRPKPVPPPAA
jgi:uncharacterized membrane-anchored protein